MIITMSSPKLDYSARLLKSLESFSSRSALDLRRWYVEHIILAPEARLILPNLTPPDEIVKCAKGQNAPSYEHEGIAARLLYTHMNHREILLSGLPQLNDPKSWNQAGPMTTLCMWAFEPWNDFRYDPRTETVQTATTAGQWAFHLKGRDTEDKIGSYIRTWVSDLKAIGFTTIVEAMAKQGLISLSPSDNGMEADEFARAFEASAHLFDKFLTRNVTKEVFDIIRATPIMMFDTSTVNCVRKLAPFGNGVIPTEDIRETTDETDYITIPAGKLVKADLEFSLSRATGVDWEPLEVFDWLVDQRARIDQGFEETDTWEFWMDQSRLAVQHLLDQCPTYKSFLDHTFPATDQTAPEERDAFLRLLGAALFGTNLKIVAAFIGAPNAGKDTVIKWLTTLLGDGQVGVLSPMALTPQGDDQRAFAPLKGAKIAVVSGEVGEGRGQAILAEKLKSITSGGGTLTVAEKYEKPTTIYFDGMLIMQGNSVPTIMGGDKALYKNRLVAVEFKHPFKLQARNYDHLYQKEASTFLKVLFLMYLEYQHKGGGLIGIDPPPSWTSFGEDLEANADALSVIDRCLPSAPDKSIEIPTPVFYRALSILAKNNLGIQYPIDARRWAARLKRAGVDLNKNGSAWRTKVTRAEYRGWLMHFTLDADKSDGFFTQQDWTNALETARVAS